ncbi:MAG: hypothetical protein JXB38_20320 [Anaerolineales bacterium]|nr:hypothetical protein [Anaerolineales bacterium]
MRRLYFVLSLFGLGMAACMSGNQLIKETSPATPQPLNLLVTTSPRTPTPSPPDCAAAANVSDRELIYPVLQRVEPSPAERGQVVKLIASGGYITWEDACGTGYDESQRAFTWALDGEYQGEISCYANHCETEFEIPADFPVGIHTVDVAGGSQITFQVSFP